MYVNIHGRIMVLVHCASSHCHLSMNQVSIQSLMYFPRYGPDTHPLWQIQSWGVLGHCPSSHCHLSINQVSFQSLLYFSIYGPDRQHLWKMV